MVRNIRTKTRTEPDVAELSFSAKMNGDHYKPKMPVPISPTKPMAMLVKTDLATASDDEIAQARAAKKNYDEAMTKFKADRAAYQQEEMRLERLFKADLAAEHGVTDHPKFEVLFGKAYERGHSDGFREVANVFSDLVDLIK